MTVADAKVTSTLHVGGGDFDWSLCRTFLAVARCGSIAAAKEELGLSHPAVRRQLDRLEAALGAPLFLRSQSGVALTSLAENLLAPMEDMERSARCIERTASSTEGSALVRINASGMLCAEVLPPVLLALRRDRPDLRCEIMTGERDIVHGNADVGLHLVSPVHERIVASRVAMIRMGLFASREWMAANGEPADTEWLLERRALIARLDAGDEGGASGLPMSVEGSAVTVAGSEVLPFIRMGLGVGALPVAAAERRNDLVRVLPDLFTEQPVWLSVHAELRHVPHVRHVMDALRDMTPALLS